MCCLALEGLVFPAASRIAVRPLQVLIDQYDTNHDGQIDYPEFLAMMRAQNEELVQASTYLRRRSSTMC